MHPPFRHAPTPPPTPAYFCGDSCNSVSVRLLSHGDPSWVGIIASRQRLCDRIMAGWRFGDPPPPSAGADAYASFLKDFQDWQRVLGDPDALIGRPNVEIIVTEDGDPYFCEGFRFAAIGLHHRECAEFACKFLGKQLKNPQRSAWGAAGSDGAAQFWLAMVLQASRFLRDGG
jgi:hypothetical protein